MNNETNDGAPRTSKAGVTPDKDLRGYTSPPRDVQRLPTRTPGWVAVPKWPADKENAR